MQRIPSRASAQASRETERKEICDEEATEKGRSINFSPRRVLFPTIVAGQDKIPAAQFERLNTAHNDELSDDILLQIENFDSGEERTQIVDVEEGPDKIGQISDRDNEGADVLESASNQISTPHDDVPEIAIVKPKKRGTSVTIPQSVTFRRMTRSISKKIPGTSPSVSGEPTLKKQRHGKAHVNPIKGRTYDNSETSGKQRYSNSEGPDKLSSILYSNDLVDTWEKISQKKFIDQRRIDLRDFNDKSGITGKLKRAMLFQTVVKVEGYVRSVVCEVYTNLVPELRQQGKVYVRGKLYDFSPDVINVYFGSYTYNERADFDVDEIALEMSGKQTTRWTKKNTLPASQHKICTANWMPTSQHGYITQKMAFFLYKVGHGIRVNLGKLLYDLIVATREGKEGRKSLIMPNMIYSLLVLQGFEKENHEFCEALQPRIKVDYRLLTGAHVQNLGTPEVARRRNRKSYDGEDTSAAVSGIKQTITYLREEYQSWEKLKKLAADKQAHIMHLFSILQQEEEEEAEGQPDIPNSEPVNNTNPSPPSGINVQIPTSAHTSSGSSSQNCSTHSASTDSRKDSPQAHSQSVEGKSS